jgi:hypothetical protein
VSSRGEQRNSSGRASKCGCPKVFRMWLSKMASHYCASSRRGGRLKPLLLTDSPGRSVGWPTSTMRIRNCEKSSARSSTATPTEKFLEIFEISACAQI